MYSIYDEVARERVRDARSAASNQRLASQATAARRWHRVADWATSRSTRADQVLSDTCTVR